MCSDGREQEGDMWVKRVWLEKEGKSCLLEAEGKLPSEDWSAVGYSSTQSVGDQGPTPQ